MMATIRRCIAILAASIGVCGAWGSMAAIIAITVFDLSEAHAWFFVGLLSGLLVLALVWKKFLEYSDLKIEVNDRDSGKFPSISLVYFSVDKLASVASRPSQFASQVAAEIFTKMETIDNTKKVLDGKIN